MKKILLIAFITLCCLKNFAQSDSTKVQTTPLSERMFFGGDLGLLFGNRTLIDISPIVGIKINSQISIGGGPIFQYYSFRSQSEDFSTTTYGGRVLGRYYIGETFFAHAEFQTISLEHYNNFRNQLVRSTVPIALLGGGYLQNLGGDVYLNIQILIDVIEDTYSPYINPIIRGGIIVNPF